MLPSDFVAAVLSMVQSSWTQNIAETMPNASMMSVCCLLSAIDLIAEHNQASDIAHAMIIQLAVLILAQNGQDTLLAYQQGQDWLRRLIQGFNDAPTTDQDLVVSLINQVQL